MLANLKIPVTIFCLYTFWIFKKAHLQISKYLGRFFPYPTFQIFKKAYFQIWKYLGQFFAYTLFKYFKKYTCNSQNTYNNFLLILFSNIWKAYLQISNYLWQCFPYILFKYLKKHTYKSQKNLGWLCAYPPFQIFKKSILANLKIPVAIFCLYIF